MISAPILALASASELLDNSGIGLFCGAVRFGHETAVVGASSSSVNSETGVPNSRPAADRLQSEIENPGALRDVSKAPVKIRIGLMLQLEARFDLGLAKHRQPVHQLSHLPSCVITSSVRAPSSKFERPP